MIEAAAKQKISSPIFGDRNVDDGVECQSEKIAGGAPRLSQRKSGLAQRQAAKIKSARSPKYLSRIARHTTRDEGTAASHEVFVVPLSTLAPKPTL